MAFTDAARWFLSMLHVATTWQSGSLMKLPVLLGPCIPQPTMPMVMRSEGAGRPSAPSALAGMMVGAATATAVVAIKRRREFRGCPGLYFPWVLVKFALIPGRNALPAENAAESITFVWLNMRGVLRRIDE